MEPEEIKQLRQRLGWSLGKFGRHFGVTPQAVFKWENGVTEPNDFAKATMVQLRSRLDAAKGEQQKQQLINGLKRALLTGGVLALLAYLFNEDN